MKKTLLVLAISVLGAALLGGCVSGDTKATKEEEQAFRNPPKEPPPEAQAAMQRGMQAGMDKARETQQANSTPR